MIIVPKAQNKDDIENYTDFQLMRSILTSEVIHPSNTSLEIATLTPRIFIKMTN